MTVRAPVANLHEALLHRALPTIIRWNRLEGRPRGSGHFLRAVRAEVRDAAWMLCRQWQLGEFEGEDCGSPTQARMHVRHAPFTDYAPLAGASATMNAADPLEPLAESLPIALETGAKPVSLDIRLAIGRRWLAMLGADTNLSGYRNAYISRFSVDAPDLATRQSGLLEAHRDAAQMFAAAAGRCLDGGKLLKHLGTNSASAGLPGLLPAHAGPLDALGPKLIAWYARVFEQPQANDAWRAERLEYAFTIDAASRPDAARFTADEHHSGRVEWHSFDVAPAERTETPPETGATRTLLPVPVQFDGMPHPRWWRFEDGRVNLGDVSVDTGDIGRLMLIEFALVYGNDWFLTPLDVPVGAMSDVRGLAVTSTFGDRTWIEPSGRGQDHNWRDWRMFAMTLSGADAADAEGLMLPNAAVKIHDGPPLEEVLLIRDEVSNLVWGIERTTTLPHGEGKPGAETSAEMLAYQRRWFPEAPPVTWRADRRYELMNSPPEHWIPFIPAQKPGQSRAVRLQRAVMLRTLEGDALGPQKIRPRTSLLRHGIDANQPYFLFEEEVTRAGVRVTKRFRRTRAKDGRVITWLAAIKQMGRGGGASGLAFDRMLPT